MPIFPRFIGAAWVSAISTMFPYAALAQAPVASAAPASLTQFHLDAETDPTAFVLSGHSLHLGLGQGAWRVDLGAFAMNVPEFVHGNSDFDTAFNGFGAKVQYFPMEDQAKLFFGVDASINRVSVERRNSELAVHQNQPSVGVNIGYRVMLPAAFYVTPWIGVGKVFNAQDITLGDKVFTMAPYSIFPAIHLGRRFQ